MLVHCRAVQMPSEYEVHDIVSRLAKAATSIQQSSSMLKSPDLPYLPLVEAH